MTAFKSAWFDWEPAKTSQEQPDKADKRASVSSVGSLNRRFQPENAESETNPTTLKAPIGAPDKADRGPAPVPAGDGDAFLAPTWGAETARLIRWFRTATPPAERFELMPGVVIANPALWWPTIASDIAAGPQHARGLTGALAGDLAKLYKLFGDHAS